MTPFALPFENIFNLFLLLPPPLAWPGVFLFLPVLGNKTGGCGVEGDLSDLCLRFRTPSTAPFGMAHPLHMGVIVGNERTFVLHSDTAFDLYDS